MKGKEVKHVHWRYRVEMENQKNDRGYESDGAESDTSVKTVRSAEGSTGRLTAVK